MEQDNDENIILCGDSSDIYEAIKKKNELLDAHCHELYLKYKYQLYCDCESEKNQLPFEEWVKIEENKDSYKNK